MLTKITIIGLFNEIDYEIPLMDGPLTYIHAQNGKGKSTVMKLVYNILQGNLEDVRTVPFQRMDLIFDSGKLIVENRNQELTVLISKNQVEEEISPEELCQVMKATYIDPERAYTLDDTGNLVPSVNIFMNELSRKIGKILADSEIQVVPSQEESKYTDADLDMMFKNIEAKINFIKQAGFQPSISSRYRFPPSRYEIGERRETYTALALALKNYVDRHYSFAESIVIYKDIVNTLYVNKTIEINNKGFIEARMSKTGTVVPISKFSSGEKQILILFYILLFKSAPGSLVIVDEPEVSLHVSWQQQLGKFMTDIAKIRNLQLIISTHSPSIIHDCWDFAVELGEETKS